jgi:hypothetical protein
MEAGAGGVIHAIFHELCVTTSLYKGQQDDPRSGNGRKAQPRSRTPSHNPSRPDITWLKVSHVVMLSDDVTAVPSLNVVVEFQYMYQSNRETKIFNFYYDNNYYLHVP